MYIVWREVRVCGRVRACVRVCVPKYLCHIALIKVNKLRANIAVQKIVNKHIAIYNVNNRHDYLLFKRNCPDMLHTHTHTHIHTHTYTHTYIYIYIHARTHTSQKTTYQPVYMYDPESNPCKVQLAWPYYPITSRLHNTFIIRDKWYTVVTWPLCEAQ